jgi:hypothetical protein
MSLAFTLEPTFYADFTLDNLNSRQLQLVHGQFAYDSASSTALTVTQAMVGLSRILGFVSCGTGDVFFNFSVANSTIEPVSGVFSSATGFTAFLSTASSAIASITSIPFLCWGFR